jgi:hypothetical protein
MRPSYCIVTVFTLSLYKIHQVNAQCKVCVHPSVCLTSEPDQRFCHVRYWASTTTFIHVPHKRLGYKNLTGDLQPLF